MVKHIYYQLGTYRVSKRRKSPGRWEIAMWKFKEEDEYQESARSQRGCKSGKRGRRELKERIQGGVDSGRKKFKQLKESHT